MAPTWSSFPQRPQLRRCRIQPSTSCFVGSGRSGAEEIELRPAQVRPIKLGTPPNGPVLFLNARYSIFVGTALRHMVVWHQC